MAPADEPRRGWGMAFITKHYEVHGNSWKCDIRHSRCVGASGIGFCVPNYAGKKISLELRPGPLIVHCQVYEV